MVCYTGPAARSASEAAIDWHTADLQVFRWVNQTHTWWLDWPLIATLWLGELGFLWIVVTLVLWCRRSPWAPYFTYLLLGTVFLNDLVLHTLVDRVRPYITLDSVRMLGWPWDSSSSVSGQAILAVARAVLVHHAFPHWRRSVGFGEPHRVAWVCLLRWSFSCSLARLRGSPGSAYG